MPKFLVDVSRTCIASTRIEVEAATADYAQIKALAKAECEIDFSGLEQNAEYEVSGIAPAE